MEGFRDLSLIQCVASRFGGRTRTSFRSRVRRDLQHTHQELADVGRSGESVRDTSEVFLVEGKRLLDELTLGVRGESQGVVAILELEELEGDVLVWDWHGHDLENVSPCPGEYNEAVIVHSEAPMNPSVRVSRTWGL